jgi:hypothetical protein
MYTQEINVGAVVPAGSGVIGVDDLDAAAAVHGEWLVMKSCVIKRLMFFVTEAVVADTTPPQVRFSKRVLQGSDSGAVVLGSLIIPHGTAVGKILYKDIDPVLLSPGDTIKLENTVQTVDAGSSTETGQGYYGFELDLNPEYVGNESDMVESA